MALRKRKYPSKLLLFGEYGVLIGLDALAIPYNQFWGRMQTNTGNPDKTFIKILEHLKKFKGSLPFMFDLEKFEKDVHSGLKFDSNIPLNHGLGSSGAIVAAVFENYFYTKKRREKADLRAVKTTLALIESLFHGISSGIDPLVSLTRNPILVKKSGGVIYLDRKILPHRRKLTLFLVDSKMPGKTGDMVTQFMERMNEIEFSANFRNAYQKYSNGAINALLKGNNNKFVKTFKELSKFQMEEMGVLIPGHIKQLFMQGLNTNYFYLKICGSGGGGFFLGITQDKAKVNEIINLPIMYL